MQHVHSIEQMPSQFREYNSKSATARLFFPNFIIQQAVGWLKVGIVSSSHIAFSFPPDDYAVEAAAAAAAAAL